MPGTLHIIATPIGNLEDITLRAVRLLGSSAVIAAEDTRRSAKLLTHLGLPARALSYHAHNAAARIPVLLARLKAGEDVALITDAGTPGVSDPGVELVQACIREDIPVNPVPGASAPLAAVVASGFPAVPMTIFGFAPPKAKDRMDWLRSLAAVEHTTTFFESPVRIDATLGVMTELFGERPICAARELTKAHQELLRGSAAEVRSRLTMHRGEFTVVVGPRQEPLREAATVSDAQLLAELGQITELGSSTRRMAVSALAKTYNRTPRDIYAAIERAKQGDN
jgi:16S rRNA (cytidine1402-2'-O)-methyltransferase